MFNLTSEEIDDLRAKLLAAVLTRALEGQLADLAMLLAKDLDGFSALMNDLGQTLIPVETDAVGHRLWDAVQEQIRQSSASN